MEDEALGAVLDCWAGAAPPYGDGSDPQPTIDAASAIVVSRRLSFRRFLLSDMIDGCSIKVVRTCQLAGVAIICRVDAFQTAKRVTIPAHFGSGRLNFWRHCPSSYSIKSKI